MDKKIAMFCLCALIAIFVIPSVIRAASFDCSKANTKTEKAICDDPILSKLDDDMATAYSKALKTSDRDAVKMEQRKWLKEILAPCIEDKVCIKKAYENRLRQLESSALSEEIPAESYYTMLRSASKACSAMLAFLNSPFSEELGGVKLIREVNANGVKLEFPNGESLKPVEVDFDNDGFVDQVFMDEGCGSYIAGTILYVAFGSKKNNFSKTKKISITDVKIFPCQFDKSVSKSSSCPTISQESDEAGINVSIDKKEVFFRGRYTEIMMVRYKEKTYLILRSNSEDTKMFGGVIEPCGGTKYKSTCLFKKSKKRK